MPRWSLWYGSAVEKLSIHYPGMEYQHKWGSNIFCAREYIKINAISAALKFPKISHRGAQQRPQMAQQTLDDFHINLQLPLSHQDHSFNRKLSKKLSNNLALHWLSCLNCRGRSVVHQSGVYWQSSNQLRSFGTSPISLTLSLYTNATRTVL